MARSMYTFFKIIRFLKDKNVKMSRKLLFLIPVAYLLFPFDLVMDFFPLAGQLDDIAVFAVMWPILRGLLSNYDGGGNEHVSNKKKKDSIDIDDYKVE